MTIIAKLESLIADVKCMFTLLEERDLSRIIVPSSSNSLCKHKSKVKIADQHKPPIKTGEDLQTPTSLAKSKMNTSPSSHVKASPDGTKEEDQSSHQK